MTGVSDQRSAVDINVGDVYEDCAFHLVLRTDVIDEGSGYSLMGISLIDGSEPRSCDIQHCGPVRVPSSRSWPSSEAGRHTYVVAWPN